MRFYGIDFVAHELDVHRSSLRRWEENELISPERVNMGKFSVRIYDEEDLELLRKAKQLMDSGIESREAFDRAHYEMAQKEIQND